MMYKGSTNMKYMCMRVSMYDVPGQHNYEICVCVCLCMMYKGSTNMKYVYACVCMNYKGSTSMKYMCMRVSVYVCMLSVAKLGCRDLWRCTTGVAFEVV